MRRFEPRCEAASWVLHTTERGHDNIRFIRFVSRKEAPVHGTRRIDPGQTVQGASSVSSKPLRPCAALAVQGTPFARLVPLFDVCVVSFYPPEQFDIVSVPGSRAGKHLGQRILGSVR